MLHGCGFLTGLVYVTRSGVLWIELADHFVPLYLTVIVGLSECVLVSRARGGAALVAGLSAADRRSGTWWVLCWKFLIPPVLAVLLLTQVVSELRAPYGAAEPDVLSDILGAANATAHGGGGGAYPPSASAVGWLLALGPMALISCGLPGCRRPARAAKAGPIAEVTPSGALSTLALDAEVEVELRGGGVGPMA